MVNRDDIEKWINTSCDDGWDPAKDGWDLESYEDDIAPPLTPNELKRVHEELAVWHSPADTRQAADNLTKRCRSSEIFQNPRLKFLLDAWTLAIFVGHKPVDRVRLAAASDRWPDGYVQIGQRTENVEVTIALTARRKLGDEYKPGPNKPTLDPVDNWVERAEGIPAALEKAIEKKLAKRYGRSCWLVVYLDINEYGIRQRETERAIAAIKQRHAQSFGGLFVIWKDQLL